MSFNFDCVCGLKAIITEVKHFSEDRDVGKLYLSTQFELDRFTNNGDLLSDRNHWTHTHTHTHTDTHTLTHTETETETDTLPHIPYRVE